MDAFEAEKLGDREAIIEWLQRFGREEGARDVEVGRWLLAAQRTKAHGLAGAASVYELADKLLGWGGHTVTERLRVARALESLPRMAAAIGAGELAWSKARELTRIATPENEAGWIERARELSVRQLEHEMRGRRPGDGPDDPRDPSLSRETFRFELGAETAATYRQAADWVRREVDPSLTEEQVLLHLAKVAMASGGGGSEGDPGKVSARPACQLALTVCVCCQRGFQNAAGLEAPVPNAVVERALCDAECIGFVDPACEKLAAQVSTEGLPPLLASHVGPAPQPNNRQIPPETARKVMRRDKAACRVPGCNHRRFIEIHHIELRVDGGSNEPDNLLVLCGTHHKLLHDGYLFIERQPSGKLLFGHADGRTYGTVLLPSDLAANAAAFSALRALRFGERVSRRLLKAARKRLGSGSTAEALTKEAVRLSRVGTAPSVVREEAAVYRVSPVPRGSGCRAA